MIVHIGFGKTGTTSLQSHVFPRLVELGVVAAYNPPSIKERLGRFRRGDRREIPVLSEAFACLHDETLISLETLLGWNPGTWGERLEMNRSVLPPHTQILITIRDPASYLRSVYQQNVAKGNVVHERQFFLEREAYDAAKLTARARIGEIFSVDDFCYRSIINSYSSDYRVIVASLPAVATLDFLGPLGLRPEPEALASLRYAMRSENRLNRSYSARAVSLTLGRERLLNALGLKTLGAYDRDWQKFFLTEDAAVQASSSLLARIGSRIRIPRWRQIMTRGLDVVLPYKSFDLDDATPLGRHHADNVAVWRSLLNANAGVIALNPGDRLPEPGKEG